MNYQEHYNRLIQRAKEREIYVYTEKHHIIPRCLGGTDDSENLVRLTGREHFIAHLLLSKIHPKSYGLIKAVVMMCCASKNQNRSMNRVYGWVREKFSESMSIAQSGERNSQFGTIWIHNLELKENKKIKKDEFTSWVQEGWCKGRVFDFEKHNEKVIKNNEKVIKREKEKFIRTQLYNEYYIIYKEVGFEKFVEITNYNFSQSNLVQTFAQLVENFVPQNGKSRKKI